MVLKPLFSAMIDLEIPRDKCMHFTRSRAWERSNPGFPIDYGFMRSSLDYELFTPIGIDLGTSRSQVWHFYLDLWYVFGF